MVVAIDHFFVTFSCIFLVLDTFPFVSPTLPYLGLFGCLSGFFFVYDDDICIHIS